jgi:hypothetical protein
MEILGFLFVFGVPIVCLLYGLNGLLTGEMQMRWLSLSGLVARVAGVGYICIGVAWLYFVWDLSRR